MSRGRILYSFSIKENIPYRKVGTHRWVRAEDVLAYRRKTERARRKEHLEAYEKMGMTKFPSAIQAYSDSI